MKKIRLLTTGGTIASSQQEHSDRVVANIGGEDLKACLRTPLENIQLEVEEFCNVGSFDFTLPLAFSLAQAIDRLLATQDCDGVVVTHGTDTMEESAYLADLVVGSPKPIVFTGAQRHAGEVDTDGPRNIHDAISVAAATQSRDLGALILFEQHIHAARHATKFHTSRVDTFRSHSNGKLGEVDGGSVYIERRPVGRFHLETHEIVPDVVLIKLAMGMSPDFVDFALERGARAIVLEAFGRGNAPRGFAEATASAVRKGVPVIITSRCPDGRTLPLYGGGDGGRDLQDAGALFAGDLSGVKARILAAVLLGRYPELDDLKTQFERAVSGSGAPERLRPEAQA